MVGTRSGKRSSLTQLTPEAAKQDSDVEEPENAATLGDSNGEADLDDFGELDLSIADVGPDSDDDVDDSEKEASAENANENEDDDSPDSEDDEEEKELASLIGEEDDESSSNDGESGDGENDDESIDSDGSINSEVEIDQTAVSEVASSPAPIKVPEEETKPSKPVPKKKGKKTASKSTVPEAAEKQSTPTETSDSGHVSPEPLSLSVDLVVPKRKKNLRKKGALIRFDKLPGFQEKDSDEEANAEFRGDSNTDGTADAVAAAVNSAKKEPMLVETSDSDTEDDLHSRNTVGKIPLHWYDDEDHVGYNLDGKKISKKFQEKDRLDKFLQKMDDPNYGRTIVDPLTQKEIVLTDEEVQMIQAIQGGEFPDSSIDPYEDYIDFFTHEKRVTPVSSAPEPKSRFVPSKWEHKAIMKFVRAIRKGWLKPKKDETKAPEFYDIWKQSQATGNAQNKRLTHIAAPKMSLPGHAESYNPPAEYLPTEKERKEWEEMDPEDRPRDFLPQKYTSLRLVPAYPRFLQERFSRCLDLYLCPRQIKHRINVDPESLIPKLPKPENLQPFPVRQSMVYTGHTDRISCLSIDPTGQWLLTGSDDNTAAFWEVSTGRRVKVIQCTSAVTAVAWCPNASITLAAIAFGTTLFIVNPHLGSRLAFEGTDKMLSTAPAPQEASGSKQSVLAWEKPASTDKIQKSSGGSIRFVVPHTKFIKQIAWHAKGNYFSTVQPDGVSDSVMVHSLLRQYSQNPFKKKGRDVQCVAFHPSKPFFFVATKTHVRIYNLQTQTVTKKLSPGAQWISSIAVHPQGDNIILGSLDRRLCWFDLDLSVKPYKTLRYHRLAIRGVNFHKSYPLFASCGDEGTIHIFHGMVYSDLMQNPLIVPVKILKGHQQGSDGLGVLDCCFHPQQPWLFSAGADGTARLFTN
eukprot:m.868453 g.868453  ORF g.868453 m.868453 type:complete len:912 (-) comp23562_c0_seq9:224-2959(-)